MGRGEMCTEFLKELLKAAAVKAMASAFGKGSALFKEALTGFWSESFEEDRRHEELSTKMLSVLLLFIGLFLIAYKLRDKICFLLPYFERFVILYLVQNFVSEIADSIISSFCQGIFSFAVPLLLTRNPSSGNQVRGVWISGFYVLTEICLFLMGPGTVAGIFSTVDVFESIDEFQAIFIIRAVKFVFCVSWSFAVDQCGDRILHMGSRFLKVLGVKESKMEGYRDLKEKLWILL